MLRMLNLEHFIFLNLAASCQYLQIRERTQHGPYIMDNKTAASKVSVFQAECLWSLALSS